MKYIFLLRLYKSSNNIRMMSEEQVDEAKNYIYTNIFNLLCRLTYIFYKDN